MRKPRMTRKRLEGLGTLHGLVAADLEADPGRWTDADWSALQWLEDTVAYWRTHYATTPTEENDG